MDEWSFLIFSSKRKPLERKVRQLEMHPRSINQWISSPGPSTNIAHEQAAIDLVS
jgi:hypothetical protein